MSSPATPSVSPSSPWPAPIRLESAEVVLEPLAPHHAPDLARASADGDLSKLWVTSVPTPEGMEEAIAARLRAQAAGQLTPFAVIAKTQGEAVGSAVGETVGKAVGKAVGMTSYLNSVPNVKRVEIGGTWYAQSVQRTAINTRCKRLLLAHAFEDLGCIAVEFRTHFFNQRSRRAIERLGAKLDGILRNHYDPAGNMRDTCVYSVIAGEWPAVKRNLDFMLSRGSD